MTDITANHGRAENLGRNGKFRESFDVCVSRAVANLSTLAEYCLPFVKVGGCFVSYKSGNIEDELKQANTAIKLLGGEVTDIEKFVLPGTDIERCLIKIEKRKITPLKYPRKAGVPGKEPIR